MNFRTFAFLLLPIALPACSMRLDNASSPHPKTGATLDGKPATSTSQLATANLFPSMSATSDEAGIQVWAAFIDDSSFLPLGPGDTLTAAANGVTQPLTLDPNDKNAHYTTTLPASDATSVTIALHRTNGQPDAPASVVPISPPFTLSANGPITIPQGPIEGLDFSGIALFSITPALPPKAVVRYRLSGPCVPRALTIERDALPGGDTVGLDFPNYLDPRTHDCPVHVVVDVRSQGTWDPALNTDSKSDVLEGAQQRGVDVMVAPTPAAGAATPSTSRRAP
jgi:hypothetical protein